MTSPSQTSLQLHLSSCAETEALAEVLAAQAKAGDCFALWGEMGAGKSTFARAFLRALCGNPALEVPSPTFALVQPYDTPAGPAYHYDLWRLDGPESLYELAWDDACEGLMLVEWPQRAEDLLPQHAVSLMFAEAVGGGAQPLGDEASESAGEGRVVTITNWPADRPFPENFKRFDAKRAVGTSSGKRHS